MVFLSLSVITAIISPRMGTMLKNPLSLILHGFSNKFLPMKNFGKNADVILFKKINDLRSNTVSIRNTICEACFSLTNLALPLRNRVFRHRTVRVGNRSFSATE